MITAVWVQTAVLAVTGVLVCWYTVETYKLRREMVKQNLISLRPIILPHLREALAAPDQPNTALRLKNCGQGCAVNITVEMSPVDASSLGLGLITLCFEALPYLPISEVVDVPFKVLANGQNANGSIFDRVFLPRYNGPAVDIGIRFEDVEGAAYSVPVSVKGGKAQIGSITRLL